MNCANHPELVATAFCQNCGKPLCPACVRTSEGLILCEPCLLARQPAAGAGASSTTAGSAPGYASSAASSAASGYATAAGAGTSSVPAGGYTPVSGYRPIPGTMPAGPPQGPGAHASPVIAGLLGFIPGVGAMYNGQFIKALLHVVVFILLIGLTEHFDLLGLLIPAWIFYQVFDAAQTAGARRDGRPLPDPFGILDMSQRLSAQGTPYQPPVGPYAAPWPPVAPAASASASSTGETMAGAYTAPQSVSYGAGPIPVSAPVYHPGEGPGSSAVVESAWAAQPYTAIPQPPPVVVPATRTEPVGAIVLIVVGALLLLSTLGYLNTDFLLRGWPVLLLLLGVWLLVRRLRTPPPVPPQPGFSPSSAPFGPLPGNPPPEPVPPVTQTQDPEEGSR